MQRMSTGFFEQVVEIDRSVMQVLHKVRVDALQPFAHVVLNGKIFALCSASGPISDRGTCRASATISMKRPVPPAHLSFITKSATSPCAPTRMPLLSCPPTSSTVVSAVGRSSSRKRRSLRSRERPPDFEEFDYRTALVPIFGKDIGASVLGHAAKLIGDAISQLSA